MRCGKEGWSRPVLFLEQPRKKFRSELGDKKGPCVSIEANLEITVGCVQCYGLGVCKEGTREV